MMANITIENDSDSKLLFSSFNKGDGGGGAPLDHKWVDAHGSDTLNAGDFDCLGIGVQIQSGGVWIGGDPKDGPYITAGGTFTFSITKQVSKEC